MTDRSQQPSALHRALTVLVPVALLAGVGVYAVLNYDSSGESGLDPQWHYDDSSVDAIDPGLVEYVEMETLDLPLTAPTGLAVTDEAIWIAGDGALVKLDRAGREVIRHELGEARPRFVDVAPDGQVYVVTRYEVGPVSEDGTFEPFPLEQHLDRHLTCVDATGTAVFVADAGLRRAYRFDRSGERINTIGEPSERTGAPGLKIPSPYLDLRVDDTGLVRLVNPGRLRVEAYSVDGMYNEPLNWGEASSDVEGFVGCCNPIHLALLPDGAGYVTAEKGSPRVKIYDAEGNFVCVVASPESFEKADRIADLATDSQGRVYVLDGHRKQVRVFVHKESPRRPETPPTASDPNPGTP